MSSGETIRPMVPDEAGQASRVVVAAVRAGFARHYSAEVIEAVAAGNSPEALRAHAGKQVDYVCVRDGRIVAMTGLKRNEIGHLFVDPACAGRGIGRRLVEFAAESFRRAGHHHTVVLSSLNATDFYARCGFAEESRGSLMLGPGLTLAYVRMHMPLPAKGEGGSI